MNAWIFVVAFAVATLAPFMSAYDNADAEWAELAQDEAAADAPAQTEEQA